MNAVLRYIQRLVAVEQSRAQGDQELLRRFVKDRDEAAFAALVERHGPLVWSACRRLLKSEQDAEDVLQATFLVFVRKAASLGQGSVGNWLYGVAYRLALKARTQAARRRARERLAAETSRPQPAGPITQNEWQCILDEELERLPEKYRAPILLCCLQGKSRDEAAQALGWAAGAVKIRLERGRELLRVRLARRGVALSAALSVGLIANSAVAALPVRLSAGIVEAGMKFATSPQLAGLVTPSVSSLVSGFLKGAALTRIKIIVGMVLLALSGVGVGAGVLGTPSVRPEANLQGKPEKNTPAASGVSVKNAGDPAVRDQPAPPTPLPQPPTPGEKQPPTDENPALTGVFGGVREGRKTISLRLDTGEAVYELAPIVEVAIDGKEAQVSDLKPSFPVRVTLTPDGKRAIRIVADGPTVPCRLLALDSDARTVTVTWKKSEKGRRTFPVGEGADVLIDGKQATLADLKADTNVSIRLTADGLRVLRIVVPAE